MSKKQDNNSEKMIPEKQKKTKTTSEHINEPIPKTPEKKPEERIQQELYELMEPFPLPPKINILFTATSNGNSTYSHDMKVIETPYTHQNPRFISNDMEDMHGDLRPITGRIFWEGTPAKSEQSESEEEDESSNPESEEMIPESDRNDSEFYEKEEESEDNPEKEEITEKPKPSTQKVERERQFTKRINQQRKLLEQFSVPEANNANGGKKVFCNCKKTKCLKLYCDCFRINQTCDGCNCMGCHNLEEYAEERNNAILVLMDRNPDPFSQKINEDKHLKGCNCKKSFCLKKYCECFQAALKCGENCKCDECKNGGGREKRERDRMLREVHEVQEPIASI